MSDVPVTLLMGSRETGLDATDPMLWEQYAH